MGDAPLPIIPRHDTCLWDHLNKAVRESAKGARKCSRIFDSVIVWIRPAGVVITLVPPPCHPTRTPKAASSGEHHTKLAKLGADSYLLSPPRSWIYVLYHATAIFHHASIFELSGI